MSRKFTDNEIENMVGAYVAAVKEGADYEARNLVMKALASERQVTINVIRAKLVSEGVYKKREVAKSTTSDTKAEIVSAFEAIMGVKLPSMGNMTKKDLEVFWERFLAASEARNVSEGK